MVWYMGIFTMVIFLWMHVIEGCKPKITLFDFDAAEYFWFASEVCVALINCLPLPRSNTAYRREYALHFLHHFLSGYRLEKPFNGFWLDQIPLFLKHYELLNYAYYHKYWDICSPDRTSGNGSK